MLPLVFPHRYTAVLQQALRKRISGEHDAVPRAHSQHVAGHGLIFPVGDLDERDPASEQPDPQVRIVQEVAVAGDDGVDPARQGGRHDRRVIRVTDLDLDDDLRKQLSERGHEIVDVLLSDAEASDAWARQHVEELTHEIPRHDRVDACIDGYREYRACISGDPDGSGSGLPDADCDDAWDSPICESCSIDWSLVSAMVPLQDVVTTYAVEMRCSTAPDCRDGRTIEIVVDCFNGAPNTYGLRELRALSKEMLTWQGPLDVDWLRGSFEASEDVGDYVADFTNDIPKSHVLTAGYLARPAREGEDVTGIAVDADVIVRDAIPQIVESPGSVGVQRNGDVVGVISKDDILHLVADDATEGSST